MAQSSRLSKSLEDEYLLLEDIFMKGDYNQKLSVIQALPQLFQYDNNAIFAKILTRIEHELPKSSAEFHITTSQIFAILIQRQLYTNLIDVVLKGIEYKEIVISNVWLETLLEIIPVLTEEQVKNDVIKLAHLKSQLSNSTYWRINSCKILGKVAIHSSIGSLDVKSNILPLVQSLCQDCSEEVRAAMCNQLHLIAQSLNDNLVKSGLLPCLVELAADDNASVRSSAVVAVVLIIPYLTKQTKIETIVPLIKQLCDKSIQIHDTTTLLTITREFGKLLDCLKDSASANDCLWFLKFYQTVILENDSSKSFVDKEMAITYRQECAYNLPSVTCFIKPQIATHLKLWHTIFNQLVNDRSFIVRKAVASCVFEIIKILDSNSNVLMEDLMNLLCDDNDEILQVLIPSLGVILEILSSHNILMKDKILPQTLKLSKAIQKCQKQLFKNYNWRGQVCFLIQLEYLPKCMTSSFIFEHFIPIIFDIIIQARAKPVRNQASKTLLVLLKNSSTEFERKFIRKRIIIRLCQAESCYIRQIYIQMCSYALEIFSQRYFKEHFLSSLLGLLDDPVSNIRFSTLKLLSSLKTIYSCDKEIEKKINDYIIKLENNEKDKDVKDMLICCKMKLNETNNSNDYQKCLTENRSKRVSESGEKQRKEAKVCLQHLMSKSTSELELSTTKSCDMRFLEKHFYIDAGITLPSNVKNKSIRCKTTTTKLTFEYTKTEINKLPVSLASLENLEISTTKNVTDDLKVNLRNLKKNQNNKLNTTKPDYKENDHIKLNNTKRYSSVFPNENQKTHNFGITRNNLNRRSLNLGVVVSDFSKIPVCLKKSKSNIDMKKKNVSSSNQNLNDIKVEKSLSNNLKQNYDGKVQVRLKNTVKNDNSKSNGLVKNDNRRNSVKLSNLPVLKR